MSKNFFVEERRKTIQKIDDILKGFGEVDYDRAASYMAYYLGVSKQKFKEYTQILVDMDKIEIKGGVIYHKEIKRKENKQNGDEQ